MSSARSSWFAPVTLASAAPISGTLGRTDTGSFVRSCRCSHVRHFDPRVSKTIASSGPSWSSLPPEVDPDLHRIRSSQRPVRHLHVDVSSTDGMKRNMPNPAGDGASVMIAADVAEVDDQVILREVRGVSLHPSVAVIACPDVRRLLPEDRGRHDPHEQLQEGVCLGLRDEAAALEQRTVGLLFVVLVQLADGAVYSLIVRSGYQAILS